MKSYSQFSESLNDLYLKEWEKLDEDTQKEFIRQYAEENNIELDEENLEVFQEAVATAMATSPLWLPPLLKAGAWTTGILGTAWAANKHLKNREERKNAETFLQSKELPKSNRTETQRNETSKTNKENEKLENKNQKESDKINKEMQNRNNTNQNKPPSNWKKFKDRLTNNPVSNTVKTAWNNPLKTLGAAVGLDWAGKQINPNLRTPNNNNGVTTDNNNKNNNKTDPTKRMVPYTK